MKVQVKDSNVSNELENYDDRTLMKELYDRGVAVKEYFGVCIELEEAANARTMTVDDALLAGYGEREY